jgi:hypothetical protein
MEQTAIQPGLPPQASTAIKELPPAAPKAARAPRSGALRALEMAADLRITVFLFALAMLIVFWGTLAQVDNGVWTVVQKYFRCYVAWVPIKVISFNAFDWATAEIPFPGGWAIGTAMLINLLAAHAIRFKLTWSRSGIIMIHAGIIIMMVGEFITGKYAVEGQMIIKVGGSSNTVIHPGQCELAIIQTLDDRKDEVATVPAHLLERGGNIENANLPFHIEVIEYMRNSDLIAAPNNGIANRGFGKQHIAKEIPEVNGVDPNQRFDAPSAYLRLSDKDGKVLGTWLFSLHFTDPQWIDIDGKKYQVLLRFKEKTRDFSLHLTKFTHAVYPGTEKPRDFHSYVILNDPAEGVVDRPVEIYMNTPLYYRGETFYQSSWTTGMDGKADGTVLQIVRNPGWLMPYVSCAVVGLGLLVHFGLTLFRFVERTVLR